jgi:hypothetical protein
MESSEPVAPSESILKSQIPSPVDVIPPMDSGCGCSSSPKVHPKDFDYSATSFIYALGKVNLRFPNLSVEKEFAQATGRAETAGLSDRQLMYSVLSKQENRYLVYKMCWVMTIEGQDTYILFPTHPGDYDLLVESLRPTPSLDDIDVVIGTMGPIASPDTCNGLTVPIVMFDQIYSFDVDTLIKSIPKPGKGDDHQFKEAAEELFWKVKQMADNKGETDPHRALNYLVVRYPSVYAKTAEAHASNSSLTSVYGRPSRLSGTRRIIDVIFTFNHRQTDVSEKYFVRVDVTEEFPFLVTKMSAYYDR